MLAQTIEHPVELTAPPPPLPSHPSKPKEPPLLNTNIRVVYENVQDSVRRNTSLRSLRSQSVEQDAAPVKGSLPSSNTSTLSHPKTLPFETSTSMSRTYNNSEADLSVGPALRVVNDSLNSRGMEYDLVVESCLHCLRAHFQAVRRWIRPVVMKITMQLRCVPKPIVTRSIEHRAKVDKSDEE